MRTIDPVRPGEFGEIRERFLDGLPVQFERLGLDATALGELQTERLRRLVRTAVDRSPFHRRRLDGIDPDSITLADLAALPPMTKEEMMAEFDDVVTDPALRLDLLDRHLATVGDAPALYRNRHLVLASGGSSGTRGVFVAEIDEAAQHMAAVVRGGLAGVAAMVGWPPPAPAPMTIVAAPACVHATRALSSIFLPGRLAQITHAPVTAPFDAIVETVQQSQPLLLIGYPSVIARLADVQRDGRLSIDPISISVTSEQLTEDHLARITAGFGSPPTNSYGTTEGLMGNAPPGSDIFDFASDDAYVEFVDAHDNPTGPGETADHVLVTNLYNHTQPLIRYRIDDRMTQAPAAADHGHQRATLDGRSDELLDIGGVRVHPLTIRSPLVAEKAVGDYQVRLGADGTIEIDIVPAAGATVDLSHLESKIAVSVSGSGARCGHVRARVVEQIPRDPRTGKARRFVTSPVAQPEPGVPAR